MNHASFIVKIIDKPTQSFFENNTSVTEVIAKFSQLRNNNSSKIIHLSIWGNLAYDANQYYQIDDYIVVEGYISLRKSMYDNNTKNQDVEMSVFKVYPFILKGP